MNTNLISRICLALALIMTVYNFFITENPIDNKAIGTILLLLIAAIAQMALKKSEK